VGVGRSISALFIIFIDGLERIWKEPAMAECGAETTPTRNRSAQPLYRDVHSLFCMEAQRSAPCSQEPPPVPVLSQYDPNLTPYFLNNCIYGACLRLDLPEWFLPLSGFPT
jgi:hypothetical protein